MQKDAMKAIIECKTKQYHKSKTVKQWRARHNQTQTQENLFQGSSHCFTSPPSPLWRISLSSKRTFIKEPYTKGITT